MSLLDVSDTAGIAHLTGLESDGLTVRSGDDQLRAGGDRRARREFDDRIASVLGDRADRSHVAERLRPRRRGGLLFPSVEQIHGMQDPVDGPAGHPSRSCG